MTHYNRYLYITLLAVLGLSPEALAQQKDTLTAARTQPAAQKAKTKYAPRLVVSIAIDQLRTDYLDAFAPLYGTHGFKRLLSQGVVFTNASYPFTPIDRASAIATLSTGVTPYYHSVVGERWLDQQTLRPVFCTGEKNTPDNIITSTLGDELKVSTQGKALVYAVAPFRDAAVLSAGHAADGAFWIDDKTGLWTTSDYYSKEIPSWLLTVNSLRSPSETAVKTPWEPVIQLSGTFNYYQHIGDQTPFKHKFTGQRRFVQFKASGMVNASVTDLAQQCISSCQMGIDRVTDLLSVTYYAGNYDHKAMTDCQMELQDTYVRLDREIGRLIQTVEQRIGKEHVLFVITSTGYSDEESADYATYRVPTGTFYINRMANLLNMYYGAIWGTGHWVETCFQNQIYLNRKMLESKRISLADATQRAQEFLSQISGVRNVYTSQQLIASTSEHIMKVRGGFNPERCGDILIEVAPGWRLQNEDNQDNLLSRASFTQFPVIIMGDGLKAERITDHVTVDRIAPTIARSIRIRAPNACSAEPLL